MVVEYWRCKVGKWIGSSGSSKEKKGGNYQRGTADTNPKRWRMVAAFSLDLSTLLEICTPWMGPEWFLPCASVANIGKNVGFLAASASRAAIHQSLSMGGYIPINVNAVNGDSLDTSSAVETSKNASSQSMKHKKSPATTATSNNLGDVTAKAGSQTIVASLLGTALGIVLSRTFCSDYGTLGILVGFVLLSGVHQVCTYKALRAVPLRSLDRHRLHILLDSYIVKNFEKILKTARGKLNNGGVEYCIPSSIDPDTAKTMKVLTPAEVAEKEFFLPMIAPDESVRWLTIGAPLMDICPSGVAELERMFLPRKSLHEGGGDGEGGNSDYFQSQQYEKYIIKLHPPKVKTSVATADNSSHNHNGSAVQLTFLEGASDADLLRGMTHAYTARAYIDNDVLRNAYAGAIGGDDGDRYFCTMDETMTQTMKETHAIMNYHMPMFLDHLQQGGWQIGTGFVNVECGSSRRLRVQSACF